VYGIVAADDAELVAGLEGIDPAHGVVCLVFGGLGAITCRVPLSEFADAPLRERLEDVAWVERVARAHEYVLDEILQRATVIPMRMCTVYRRLDGIREMVEREARVIHQLLSELAGKHEWGVKVFLHPRQATPAVSGGAAGAANARAARSGTEYLLRRRAERDRGSELERLGTEAAPEIHDRLAGLAAGARVNAPQRRELSGHPGTMILNGVYLVERARLDGFHREVERLEERYAPLGLELVATGPWPPYNFLPGEAGAGW
jgi:hypothetical protein